MLFVMAFACGSAAAGEVPPKEPVFSAPPDYMDAVPEGFFPCRKGLEPQMTHAEFRKFAFRNEVWPQEDGVDLSRASWSAGRVIHAPRVDFGFAGKARRGFKAQAYVLVDGEGRILDKVVTCSTAPAYNAQLMALLDGFRFEPSRYRGRGLTTLMPVEFGG
ncbi:hypothetical protein J2X02_002461 [Pseudoxanthomonas japonensis]|uniref:hypothetical protein n=1 Tax=Pseudoxanthomonas TaxID=83618 RepID=UPI0012ED8275|nr:MULTISPECIES: hypothetical protein [Pseudoxanthomonas]MBL8256619.1 hypothetical protein [Pseudoxanthomonas mexicana]MDR7069610.1 hypothetical protein [Pseudoxanthomonas japonensis]